MEADSGVQLCTRVNHYAKGYALGGRGAVGPQ